VCICFTEIKHKTILWNKAHYGNKTICYKEANECMLTHFCHIFFFKFQYNFKDSNGYVTFPDFSWSRKIQDFQGQNIKETLIKQNVCIFLI